MAASGMITLGVGPASNITRLVLTGLGGGGGAPPVVVATQRMRVGARVTMWHALGRDSRRGV